MAPIKNRDTDKRRNGILEMIKIDDRVKVSQLVDVFGISDVTIRNDLSEMEQQGLLRRVHGGAVGTKKSYYDMSLNDRMNINKEEKVRIAEGLAALIKDGDTLMIDSGTTTRYLARKLAERSNLTVVTNALLIAQEFAYNNSVNVILLGGQLDLQYQFAFGNDTIAQIQKYRADKMIIATDGVSANHGLTTYHHQEADVSRHMIERANQVFVAADHSKIGKEGFSYIAPVSCVSVLVTDKNEASTAELNDMRKHSIEVNEV